MGYIEQLKSSCGYHWRISCECWNILVGQLHWWIVWLFVFLCIIPILTNVLAVETSSYLKWYMSTPLPPFDPNLPQDIAYELAVTDYLFRWRGAPPFPLAFSYFWVNGRGFKFLSNALCLVAIGVLGIAYMREKPGKG